MRVRAPDPNRHEPHKFKGSGLACDLCGKESDSFFQKLAPPGPVWSDMGTEKRILALACECCWDLVFAECVKRMGDKAGDPA